MENKDKNIGLYKTDVTVWINGKKSREEYKSIWFEEELHFGQVPDTCTYDTLSINKKECIEDTIKKCIKDQDYRKSIGLNAIGIDSLFGKVRLWCYNETCQYQGYKIPLKDVVEIWVEKKTVPLDLKNYTMEKLYNRLSAEDFLKMFNYQWKNCITDYQSKIF